MKKMWYVYTKEYYSAIKKNKLEPFARTWIDLEIIILNVVSQRQIPHDIAYMWNLKYNTYEPIYKTEIDSQTQRTDLWLPREQGLEERWTGIV